MMTIQQYLIVYHSTSASDGETRGGKDCCIGVMFARATNAFKQGIRYGCTPNTLKKPHINRSPAPQTGT